MSREAKIVMAVCVAVFAACVVVASDRGPQHSQRQRPPDQTVVYARVQHGPGVTQYLPVYGSGAVACAPVYSNGELTQIRSFGNNGEQIVYTVSPGQEGRFLYIRSLGPNGTLVYEPASLNPQAKPPVADSPQVADVASQPSVPPPANFISNQPVAVVPGGKPPASAGVQSDVSADGKLAREWREIFSSLTGAVANAGADAK